MMPPVRTAYPALLLLAACTMPDRRPAAYVAAGMAGLNDPDDPSGDSDNLSAGLGIKLPFGKLPFATVTLRPEVHAGDHAVLFLPAVTHDFRLAGDGLPGSIDAHVGAGWSALTERENHVLGNRSSPFVRAGVDGYLVEGLFGGAALLVAPWGYDHEDLAIAGIVYAGARF